jgi:hypothetical protein
MTYRLQITVLCVVAQTSQPAYCHSHSGEVLQWRTDSAALDIHLAIRLLIHEELEADADYVFRFRDCVPNSLLRASSPSPH